MNYGGLKEASSVIYCIYILQIIDYISLFHTSIVHNDLYTDDADIGEMYLTEIIFSVEYQSVIWCIHDLLFVYEKTV